MRVQVFLVLLAQVQAVMIIVFRAQLHIIASQVWCPVLAQEL